MMLLTRGTNVSCAAMGVDFVRRFVVVSLIAMGAGLAALAAVSPVATAAAGRTSSVSTTYPVAYTNELTVKNWIETHGVSYTSLHKNIVTAVCTGLRNTGPKTGQHGAPTFHRFTCDLLDSNHDLYRAQVATTKGPVRGRLYVHILSIVKGVPTTG